MSHDWNDDDALDAALGRLGNPAGAAPVSSGSTLLARAKGVAPADPPTAATPRAGIRQGLRGLRLAATLAVAVGAGFLGGLAVRDGSHPDADTPHLAKVSAAPAARPETEHAAMSPDVRSTGTHAASRAGHATTADAPVPASSRVVRPRAPARRRVVRQRVAADAVRVDAAPVHDTRIAAVEPVRDTPPEAADAPAPHGAPAPARERRAGEDTEPGPRARVTLGLGGAISTVSPDLPPDGPRDLHGPDAGGLDPHAPRTATSALVTVGYSRVVADTPHAPWWSISGSFGRTAFEVREDEPDHAHGTWSADVGAGVSWNRGAARLDTGLTLGTLGFLDATRERNGSPGAHPADTPAREPDIARTPMLSVGARASLAIGTERRPRLRLDLAPRLAMANGHAPSPSLHLSLGGELGFGGRSR